MYLLPPLCRLCKRKFYCMPHKFRISYFIPPFTLHIYYNIAAGLFQELFSVSAKLFVAAPAAASSALRLPLLLLLYGIEGEVRSTREPDGSDGKPDRISRRM